MNLQLSPVLYALHKHSFIQLPLHILMNNFFGSVNNSHISASTQDIGKSWLQVRHHFWSEPKCDDNSEQQKSNLLLKLLLILIGYIFSDWNEQLMFYLLTNYFSISKQQVYLMFVRHPSAETKGILPQTSDYQDLLLKCIQFLHLALTTVYSLSRLYKHIPSIKGVDVLQVYMQLTIQSNERDRLVKRFRGSLAQMSVSPFFD